MNLVRLDLPDVGNGAAAGSGGAAAGSGRNEVHLHQFRDGWTIQPIPVHAPRGVWAFALPARLQMRLAGWVKGGLSTFGSASSHASANPVVIPGPLPALHLKNFRGFADRHLDLHERLTVLVAQNGAGKSTIIDACCLALRPFVSIFDLSGEADAVLTQDDIRMESAPVGVSRKLPCVITATGKLAKIPDLSWKLMRLDEKPDTKFDQPAQFSTRTKVEADKLQEWASELQTLVRDNPGLATNLPIFACYGAARMNSRAVFAAAVAGSDDQCNRTFGYRDCLKPDTDFQDFADWFAWLCQWRDQELARQLKFGAASNARTRWDAMLKVIQQAIDQLQSAFPKPQFILSTESEAAQTLRTMLEQHFGVQHEEMIECERLISLEGFKRKMAARKNGGVYAA